jgi:hypothetical protein
MCVRRSLTVTCVCDVSVVLSVPGKRAVCVYCVNNVCVFVECVCVCAHEPKST